MQLNHPGRQTLAGSLELAVAPSAVQVDLGPDVRQAAGAHRRRDRRADRPLRAAARIVVEPASTACRSTPHTATSSTSSSRRTDQPPRRRVGRRPGAPPPVPDRGHPSHPRGDRPGQDPVHQAQLRGLPARRLHRGRVARRHRAPRPGERRPPRDLRRHVRVAGHERRRHLGEHPPPRSVLPRLRRPRAHRHHHAAAGHRRVPHRDRA